jgi:hypothetical protein
MNDERRLKTAVLVAGGWWCSLYAPPARMVVDGGVEHRAGFRTGNAMMKGMAGMGDVSSADGRGRKPGAVA